MAADDDTHQTAYGTGLPSAEAEGGVGLAKRQFAGPGFGTVTTRLSLTELTRATPAAVSSRGQLRFGLPAVYQDSDFTMRFVGALEQVLDPIGATLDGLHHYVDPDVAPRQVLELICAWLGVETSEFQTDAELRDLARHAADLGRLRGTAEGLSLALRLTFPKLPLRVEGGGTVTWPGGDASGGDARLIVYCDRPIPADEQVALARAIEREKPVGAAYKLRVKTPKKAS